MTPLEWVLLGLFVPLSLALCSLSDRIDAWRRNR